MASNLCKVRKWGNGRAVTIPAHILAHLKWRVGDFVLVSVENGVVVMRPVVLPAIGTPTVGTETVTTGDTAA